MLTKILISGGDYDPFGGSEQTDTPQASQVNIVLDDESLLLMTASFLVCIIILLWMISPTIKKFLKKNKQR